MIRHQRIVLLHIGDKKILFHEALLPLYKRWNIGRLRWPTAVRSCSMRTICQEYLSRSFRLDSRRMQKDNLLIAIAIFLITTHYLGLLLGKQASWVGLVFLKTATWQMVLTTPQQIGWFTMHLRNLRPHGNMRNSKHFTTHLFEDWKHVCKMLATAMLFIKFSCFWVY